MRRKHRNLKTDWNKEELTRLYWEENKSLQQIGNLFGVTRERVKQVMARLNIPRRKRWACQKPQAHTPHFTSLADYLARGKDNRGTLHRFLPENISCSECKNRIHLHIHHIKYPAREEKDIQILCSSCHQIKHKLGINYIQQIDIYNSHISGVSANELSKQYNCSRITIYKIIAKIKNGWQTKNG